MKKEKTSKSAVVRFFCFLTQLFDRILAVGFLGRALTSYHKTNEFFESSHVGHWVHRMSLGGGRLYCALRRRIALAIDRSFVRRGIRFLSHSVLLCSLRTVGLFLFTAGSYSAIAYWLFAVIWRWENMGAMSLFAGIGALSIGFVFLFFDTSLGYALDNGLFFGRFLVPILGLSDESLKDIPKTGKQGYVIAVPAGMLVGVASALVSPGHLIAAILALFVCLAVLSSPESGVVLLILLLPFVGLLPGHSAWLAVAAGLTVVAFAGKLLRGNRVFRLDVTDFTVLLLLLFAVVTGLPVSGGAALQKTILRVLLMSLYFVVINVIATPEWLRRCRVALITSATASALFGIVQFILAATRARAGFSFADVSASVRVGFADKTTFAYFLLLAFPFALSAFLDAKWRYRLLAGFACVSLVAAIFLSFVQSAWLALLVMLLVFALVCDRRVFPFILGGGALAPVVFCFLPDATRRSFWNFLRADLGVAMSYTGAVHASALDVLFAGGEGARGVFERIIRVLVGIGDEGFRRFSHLGTALTPVVTEANFRFWFYQLLTGGVIGVLLLSSFFLLLFQSCFSLLRTRSPQEKKGDTTPVAGIVALTGVLIFGIFHYAWYDLSAFTAFYLVTALMAAGGRYMRKRQSAAQSVGGESGRSAASIEYFGN